MEILVIDDIRRFQETDNEGTTVNLKIIAAVPSFFLALLPSSHAAGWTVKSEVDSMTDERTHEAQTVNAGGHSLHVYRLSPRRAQ